MTHPSKDSPERTVLLSALAALTDYDVCTNLDCTDRVCWLGCLGPAEREIARSVLEELGASS